MTTAKGRVEGEGEQMGYDCHVVDSDGNEIEGSDNCYFRRNIFGMGPTRDALESVGMGYWPVSETPPFPSGPDYDDPAHYDEDDKPVSVEAKAHELACLDLLRATNDERPGIALHKFTSNDGWWVTKVECESALKLWEQAGNPTPEYFGDDLIPFLRAGAAYSGFRVW